MSLYLADFNLVACDLVRFVPFDSNFETECKLLVTQDLVRDNDCCISRNVGRIKINLVT